jgi:hypothetical protein
MLPPFKVLPEEITASSTIKAPSSALITFAGPFPTDWSSPPECTILFKDGIIVLDAAKSCLPDDFQTDTAVYYSPGTACPSGYAVATGCAQGMGSTTTTLTCCPVRFGITMSCVDNPSTTRSELADYQCTWTAGDKPRKMTYTWAGENSWGNVKTIMSDDDGVNAFGLRMVYESSDIPDPTAGGISHTNSFTSHDTSRGKPTGSADDKPSDDSISRSQSPGGLLAGAKAGLGIGITLSIMILAACAIWLYRRSGRTRQAVSPYGEMAIKGQQQQGDVSDGIYVGALKDGKQGEKYDLHSDALLMVRTH